MKYRLPIVVLLAVLSLSACRGRTILGDDERGTANGGGHHSRKKVTATVVPSNNAAPVAGKSALTAAPGSNIGTLSATNSASEVLVWYTAVEGDKISYYPETRKSATAFANQGEALTFALRQLFAGPANNGEKKLSTEIPVGSALIAVTESAGGGVVIDLSRRFVTGGGMDSFEARLEQVRRTAGGIVKGRPIFLNIDGRRLAASDDGLEVKQPICGLAPGENSAN